MQAYLIENEGVLALDKDAFANVEIVETELSIKQGRNSMGTDGRIDVLATYSGEYLAVVELKLGQLEDVHLTQLQDYLKEKDQILTNYKHLLNEDFTGAPKLIGILVGSSINLELAKKIQSGYYYCTSDSRAVPIAALTIQRFRSATGNVFVTTDTYFNSFSGTRDYSKYRFENAILGKARLVLAVLKRYAESIPGISYAELETVFPRTLQGSGGVFSALETANQHCASSGQRRHFMKPEEVIQLKDGPIAVSTQWGVGNIVNILAKANSLNYEID